MIIYEPEFWEHNHVEVNAALIATACHAFPESEIHFYAESKHLDLVQRTLQEQNVSGVEYHPLAIAPEILESRFGWLREKFKFDWLREEFQLFRRLDSELRILHASRLLFSACSLRRIKWVKLLAALNSHKCIRVVIHNTKVLMPVGSLLNRMFAQWNPQNIFYTTLAEPVAQHIKAIVPQTASYIKWISHPYFFPSDERSPILSRDCLHFGFYGFGTKKKGIDKFFQWAEEIKKSSNGNRVQFTLLGKPPTKNYSKRAGQNLVTIPGGGKVLPRNIYASIARTFHYAVFPYDPKKYTYNASGTFFDALAFATPLIALKSPFFEYFFNELGDIGYLCMTFAEMRNTIMSIVDNPPVERYKRQLQCIYEARKKLSYTATSERFRQLWESPG